MDKKIVIISSIAIVILFLFFITSSNNNISYPMESKQSIKSKQIVDIKENKIENKTSSIVQSETKTFNKQVQNIKNYKENPNEIVIENEKELDNFVYNNNLNIVAENDKEVIFAKNNPQKSELAPPMVPVIVNYKDNEKNKSIIISGDIATNNNEIYVGEKVNGEIKKLIKIPLKSKKSNQILTPPQIQ